MVLELCGGEADARRPSPARVPDDEPRHRLPLVARCSACPASTCRAPESKAILEQLGFARRRRRRPRRRSTPPSWRPDIEGKADLVEEVIRIAGVDRIEPKPLPRLEATVAKPSSRSIQKRTRLAKRTLAARGLVEAVTWSFIAKDEAELFGGGDARLALANPIASDLSDMRPSLLPGLLKAAQRNADRGFGDVALFEVGQFFASDEPEGQTIKAAAVRRGTARAEGVGRHWDGGGRARRRLRRQGGRAGAPGGARRSGRRPAGRAGRAGLVPSRPLRHAAVRAQERRSAPSARSTRRC